MPPHLRRSPRQHTVPEVVSLPCGILLRGSPVSAFGWCSHSDGVIPMAFPLHIPPTNSLAHPQPSPGYYVMGGAPDRLRFGVVRVVRQQCVLVVCEAHGCSAGYVLLCCVCVYVYMCCVVIIPTAHIYTHTIHMHAHTQCCGRVLSPASHALLYLHHALNSSKSRRVFPRRRRQTRGRREWSQALCPCVGSVCVLCLCGWLLSHL